MPTLTWSTVRLPALAVGLLAVSAAPWFRYDVESSASPYILRHTANAWQASSLWSSAVVLTVLAVVLVRCAEGRPTSGRAGSIASGLAAVALGAWLRQTWQLSHPPDAARASVLVTTLTPLGEAPVDDPYAVVRDSLPSTAAGALGGASASLTWTGALGGVLLLAILAVLLHDVIRSVRLSRPGTPSV